MDLSRQTRIVLLLSIDITFFFIEIITGYAIDSLALIADSFHMLNDIVSLLVALWATKLAHSTDYESKYTYGWQRAEILGALANGVFLIALCMFIFMEAIQRFIEPPSVSNPKLMLVVGSMGLLSNIIGMFLFHDHSHAHGHDHSSHARNYEFPEEIDDIESVLPSTIVNRCHFQDVPHDHPAADIAATENSPLLSYIGLPSGSASPRKSSSNHGAIPTSSSQKGQKSKRNLNMHGVFLHVLGDALGNVGVISAALVIGYTDYSWRYLFDPCVSVLLTFIILLSAIPLCKSAALILLQVAPQSIRIEDVSHLIGQLNGVESVHELHIWQLSDVKLIATVHVCVTLPDDQGESYMKLTKDINKVLQSFGIHECTIQPEFANHPSLCPTAN
ncbi:zinc ion transporter Zhf1 [Schizosaccharomyces cryophilus OY26]|uniref:Zinc ion transporter Zhf1 n=1 Tax=Schizosaccharomyces cryophilus (strain OY26 / ATCC MYA-4695 / CBS 11777 / NBRC 106824 / NRRL Y48691) TaxID=653667 RepID=S9VVE7_SCHCR|nr:zinc ion transporter Zhf1 [Schizosaccharomyces cryophilus OY26]EPY51758.1 zinc ion transporter Zhf1 [Schizosaccharomyces cryophilus OY26]